MRLSHSPSPLYRSTSVFSSNRALCAMEDPRSSSTFTSARDGATYTPSSSPLGDEHYDDTETESILRGFGGNATLSPSVYPASLALGSPSDSLCGLSDAPLASNYDLASPLSYCGTMIEHQSPTGRFQDITESCWTNEHWLGINNSFTGTIPVPQYTASSQSISPQSDHSGSVDRHANEGLPTPRASTAMPADHISSVQHNYPLFGQSPLPHHGEWMTDVASDSFQAIEPVVKNPTSFPLHLLGTPQLQYAPPMASATYGGSLDVDMFAQLEPELDGQTLDMPVLSNQTQHAIATSSQSGDQSIRSGPPQRQVISYDRASHISRCVDPGDQQCAGSSYLRRLTKAKSPGSVSHTFSIDRSKHTSTFKRKGGRTGGLKEKARQETADMRGYACWHCAFNRGKCNLGKMCTHCAKMSPNAKAHGLRCDRRQFGTDIMLKFLPSMCIIIRIKHPKLIIQARWIQGNCTKAFTNT